MRKTALFIISVFVFGACAPKASVKEFEDFVDAYKKVNEKNNAEAMEHVALTKANMEAVETLKKQLIQMRMHLSITIMRLGQLDANTGLTFSVLIKALNDKGIKLDLKKAWERMKQEDMEKKLKEKSK